MWISASILIRNYSGVKRRKLESDRARDPGKRWFSIFILAEMRSIVAINREEDQRFLDKEKTTWPLKGRERK